MPPHTEELRPDRVLTHQWRCRDAALDDCGLGLGARRSSRAALSSLVACAGLAAETDQPWTSFSRRRKWYAARAECGDLTYDTVIAGMKEGVEAGLFDENRALPGAHLDPVPRQSRYRATPLLIERLANARFEHVRPASSILLRDEDGRPVDYAITDRVGRLRRAMDARNEWASSFKVEVSPEADPEDWRRTAHHLHGRKVRDGKETWSCVLPDPGNRMVRIYGRKRFDCGGRAYGWWQYLPKGRRDELLINGEFTIEPDFPTLHPRFAYAMVDAEMPNDVYTTRQGHDRKHGKLALNILMNCKGGLRGAVDALMWRPTWNGSREYTQGLVQAIADLNAPIAPLLGSDAGIGFMNLDSGMAMEIMDRCRREDIPCLPVHDSFRVARKSGNHVAAIMGEVLNATLARISPSTKTTVSAGLSRVIIRDIPENIPQVPRAGAAALAASPPSASLPSPRAREAGIKDGAGKADYRPAPTVSEDPASPAPPARRTVSWSPEERLEAMTAYQVALVLAERRDPANRGLGIDWHWLLAMAPVVAKDLIDWEMEHGMRAFPRGIVPDRLPGKAKPKAPSPRSRRSSRAASPLVKGRSGMPTTWGGACARSRCRRTFRNLRPGFPGAEISGDK